MMPRDAIEDFTAAIQVTGLAPPHKIIADGKLHRFASNGRRGDDAGWYIFHGDAMPAGIFGCWRSGIEQTWRSDIGRKLSFAEAEALKRKADAARKQRDVEQQRRQTEACARAREIWDAAKPAAADHPYLRRKRIKQHGLRLHDGCLVVPMRDSAGDLRSLQFIGPNGEKQFHPGGRVKGCYYTIGEPEGAVCVAEGYATCASIHEATGIAVAVAFTVGNLEPVARAFRAKFPHLRITICADDDSGTAGNPGLTKATEAARAVSGLLAVPDFGADRPDGATDFNDVMQYRGAEAVDRAIRDAKVPDASGHQPEPPNTTAPKSGLRVLTLAELVKHQFPEREVLLGPWLLSQSLSMIHAWRGIGKTHVAIGIAYAVATGGSFLNWRAPAARRVLYIDGEMPGAALKARFVAWIDADDRDFDPDYLRIVTPDAQDEAMPDLATAEGQAAIELAAVDADLVILDNISTLYRSSGPENDAESWRGAQEWGLRMRRGKKAVLFIHHSGKTGAQRGSSKREDTLDVVINLKRPNDYADTDGARFDLRYEKYRNDSGGEDVRPIEVELTQDERGRPLWTWRSIEDSTFDRVVVLAKDGLKPGEIARELDLHKSNVSRHLKRARAEGLIPKGENHDD
jgi:putative DNA primase/helicase